MLNVQIRPEQIIPAYATVDWYELFDAAANKLGSKDLGEFLRTNGQHHSEMRMWWLIRVDEYAFDDTGRGTQVDFADWLEEVKEDDEIERWVAALIGAAVELLGDHRR